MPPLIVNVRDVSPAGTASFQNCWDPVAPLMFVTGTPLTRDAVAVVRPVRVTPEKALKPRIITKYWPAAGAVIVHVSLLPLRNGRQSNRLVVGCAPRLT